LARHQLGRHLRLHAASAKHMIKVGNDGRLIAVTSVQEH
jgi:hypothetical protein